MHCGLCRNYTESDCYIGLYQNDTVCSCLGAAVSSSDCELCRASWSWYDGTNMSWWNWRSDEPAAFGCGRLTSDGWATNSCDEPMRYVCTRGKANIMESVRL